MSLLLLSLALAATDPLAPLEGTQPEVRPERLVRRGEPVTLRLRNGPLTISTAGAGTSVGLEKRGGLPMLATPSATLQPDRAKAEPASRNRRGQGMADLWMSGSGSNDADVARPFNDAVERTAGRQGDHPDRGAALAVGQRVVGAGLRSAQGSSPASC